MESVNSILSSKSFEFIRDKADEAEKQQKAMALNRVKSRQVRKTDSVVESNALARAEYRMTLTEKRLLNLAIAKLDSTLASEEQLQDIAVTVEEYIKIYDASNHNAYTEIAQAAKRLMNRQLTVHHKDESYTIYNLLVDSTYRKKEGTVFMTINPRLTSDLINLRGQFTQYMLENVRHFKLYSSARLYEIMKSVESQRFLEVSIEDFKARLLADPNKYKKFCDLRRWVIEPALSEINTLSDIRVKYETIKRSRKIARLRFTITKNKH